MTLKEECISRIGVKDGIAVYNDIIMDCFNYGDSLDVIYEVLHIYGFEPDCVIDVLDAVS